MRSILNWLRSLWRPGEQADPQAVARPDLAEPSQPVAKPLAAEQPQQVPDPDVPATAAPRIRRLSDQESRAEAETYLGKVRSKLDRLAEDFNAGTINRAQFQNLYIHYQREIRNIEGMLELAPGSETWKGAVTEGESVIIRQQHLARAEGYTIFENDSGLPVCTLGKFELDPALVVPMLSSYRAATKEIFGAGTRSTEIEDGRWLCFVSGEFTTMLAVFSSEPAGKQLEYLEELHRHFEQANQRHLTNPPFDANTLLFPHEYFLGQWRRS
jgi:hypothetical protein